MKEFTQEMLNKLVDARNNVKGTSEYYKFDMASECKTQKGKWIFVGYYIPYTIGHIKTFKDNTYIVTGSKSTDNEHRYFVTEDVKKLLGI